MRIRALKFRRVFPQMEWRCGLRNQPEVGALRRIMEEELEKNNNNNK